jgi:CheY-like chemotaxis protein
MQPAPGVPQLQDAQILIIDDDKVSRMALERLLLREGYRVSLAEDGTEGLSLAQECEPDLILLDVVMPGLDGYQVCQALRADRRLAEVPIVMLTSLEDRASRLRGLDAGADDFVSKPYVPEELRARVATITRLNRYRRLRSERARFGWVVEQAEDGYLVVSHLGQLIYANALARGLFGWSPGQSDLLQALQAQFSLHPEEAWQSFPHLPADTPLFLWRPETPQTGPVWLEVKVLRQGTGSLTEVLLRLRDITAERSSQRSVWSFESVIAHKLRTPLTKATLGLSMLRRKAHKLDPVQITEFAEQAYHGMEELKSELDRVLKYVYCPRSSPNGAGYQLAGLGTLLEEVCASLGIPSACCTVAPCLPQEIYIDPRAFELVFWDVMENCKKFHPTGQPKVDLKVRIDSGLVVMEVQDDGRRLSPNELENAFHPYYQGEKSFTGQVPGMGLGLSKLRSLLWEVGGDCALANRCDGDGVVLTLRFRPGH